MMSNKYLAKLHADLRRQRRRMGGESPQAFMQIYLSSYCRLPFSRMHKEVYGALGELVNKRQGRLAIAAPRGHAKSTIASQGFVLWCVLCKKEKFVLLISDTRDQAVKLLKDIRDELQKNSVLIEDFPEACHPEGAPRQPKPWRNQCILLHNGAMISAYGGGQSLRGVKNKSHRPGLIIADDIENSEQVIQEEQRLKLRKWFTGTLLHAGHPSTNVVVVGTVLHHDSLLANLIDPDRGHGWTGMKYKAVEKPSDRPDLWEKWSAIYRGKEDYDDSTGPDTAEAFFESNRNEMLAGTQVLWPELDDYYALMVMREREGKASFQAEKQNEPIDPEVCIFAEDNFHYWDDEHRDVESLLDAVGRNGHFFGACDPSLGHRTGRGDYTAIVILYRPVRSKIKYVIAADIARRTPDQAIERIIQYAKMHRFAGFAVEANHFQELMIGNLRRRAEEGNVAIRVHAITNRSNKQSRIASLEPEVTQGRIRLCRRHQLLLDQLKQFPLAVHDDGPDALEMAIEVSRKLIIPDGIPMVYASNPDGQR